VPRATALGRLGGQQGGGGGGLSGVTG